MNRVRPVDWAAQQTAGSAAAKCLLLAITARAEGLIVTVTEYVLAEVTEQSVQAVRDQLELLELAGLIQRDAVPWLRIQLPMQAIGVQP